MQQGCDPGPGAACSRLCVRRAPRNGSGTAALISRERSLEQSRACWCPSALSWCGPAVRGQHPGKEGKGNGEGKILLSCALAYVVKILYCLYHVVEHSKLGLDKFPRLSPSPFPQPLKFFPFYGFWCPGEILDYLASF